MSQLLRALGPVRLAAIGGMVIVLFAFFTFLTGRISSKDMALLYADLNLADSSQIVQRLESQNIPYRLEANGSQIWVPDEHVGKLRLTMAEDGLPSGGSVGYELFDKGENFGTSAFMQNLNHVRALEGELARTIGSIQSVRGARVHIVMAKREPFSREKPKPSASIILNMGTGGRLKRPQISAIQHLVAAAIPGLKPSQISIIDNQGSLLARGTDDEAGDASYALTSNQEVKRNFERRMSKTVEELLERSIGIGKVRAEISAVLNFDRITTSKEIYDPDGRVLRSSQAVEENNESNDSSNNEAVTVQNNVPDANKENAGAGGNNSSTKGNRTEETSNYEISKTIESHLKETGNINKLSVAVIIDGSYTVAEDGTQTYQKRSEEEIDLYTNLVKTAVGFDQNRGDTIEVANVQFVTPQLPTADEDKGLMDLYGKDFIRLGEKAILGILGILVLLLIVRPLMNRFFDLSKSAAQLSYANADASGGAIDGPGGYDSLPPLPPQLNDGKSDTKDDDGNDAINMENVEGKVKASSVNKVAKLIESHPNEAVSVVRGWLHQQDS